MIVLPDDDPKRSALMLSGALVELAMLDPPETGREAIFRVRAILLAEGDPTSKLVLIASVALQGVISEEREDQLEKIRGPNVVSLRKGRAK